MTLPTPGSSWPPPEWAPAFDQYSLNDALYAGAVEDLHNIFAAAGPAASGHSRGDNPASHYNNGPGIAPRRRGFAGFIDSIRSWFWGTPNTYGQGRVRLHSPLAGNLAALSADVLMSEPPSVRFIDAKGEPLKGDAADRLDDLMNAPGMRATLLEAAEYCAGLSAVALTVHWDVANTDRPWITATACDAVIPEWEGARLVAVNLWTTYPKLDSAGRETGTYYHVERHEFGQIVHALYLGNDTEIGKPVPLGELDALRYLLEIPGGRISPADGTLELPTGLEDRLTATWWRNLPTRRFRRGGMLARIGRADCEGVEHFLDQVDMVWSSWMRDIKLARARLIVGSELLSPGGTINAPTFDDDAEILKALEFTPTADGSPLEAHQFEIRAAEHEASLLALTKEVLNHAGYSLASYGEHGDVQKTATEVSDRTTATERTRDKKALYFVAAFEPILETLLEIDRTVYGNPGLPADVSIEITFPEQSQVDPEAQARTFQYLRAAMAASTRTLVAMLHDDWDSEQIDEEVDLIVEENNIGAELDPAMVGRDGEPLDPNDPNAPDGAVGKQENPDAEIDDEAA